MHCKSRKHVFSSKIKYFIYLANLSIFSGTFIFFLDIFPNNSCICFHKFKDNFCTCVLSHNEKLIFHPSNYILIDLFSSFIFIIHYLINAIATPPSTFNVLPVDLFNNPPTKAKHALAISSGRIISFNKVRFA